MWKIPLVYVFQIHIVACNVHLLPTSFGKRETTCGIQCSMPQICCMRHQAAACRMLHVVAWDIRQQHAACCMLLLHATSGNNACSRAARCILLPLCYRAEVWNGSSAMKTLGLFVVTFVLCANRNYLL
jgi:hypothetical protein